MRNLIRHRRKHDPFPRKREPARSKSTIKILDFGLADQGRMTFRIRSGTLPYSSPEQLALKSVKSPFRPPFSCISSETFTLGTIFAEILTGKVGLEILAFLPNVQNPFNHSLQGASSIDREIMRQNILDLSIDPEVNATLTSDERDLFLRMTRRKPSARISLKSVLAHPALNYRSIRRAMGARMQEEF